MREEDDRPIGRTNGAVAGKRRVIPLIGEGVVAERAVTLLSVPEKVGTVKLRELGWHGDAAHLNFLEGA
jgi:hypothetical protein